MKIILIGILASALFLNACAWESSFLPGDATSRVNYNRKDGILSFGARTKLIDGSYLQTQLFFEGELEEWWPVNRYIKVKNGEWQISVRLGKNGAPAVLSENGTYKLEVWEKGVPSNAEEPLYFDLIPPPGPN